MNIIEHLLTCLADEGSEVTQDACKSLRFGLDDRSVLDPTGPTNRERLVIEVNQLIAVVEMLVENRQLPLNWESPDIKREKKEKVRKLFSYSYSKGCLSISKDDTL